MKIIPFAFIKISKEVEEFLMSHSNLHYDKDHILTIEPKFTLTKKGEEEGDFIINYNNKIVNHQIESVDFAHKKLRFFNKEKQLLCEYEPKDDVEGEKTEVDL